MYIASTRRLTLLIPLVVFFGLISVVHGSEDADRLTKLKEEKAALEKRLAEVEAEIAKLEPKEKTPANEKRVTREGKYEIQEVTLSLGESLKTQRGGEIKFVKVEEESITLKRQFEFVVPARPCSVSVGNHEYLDVIEVNRETSEVRFRLRTKVKFNLLEKLSF